MVLTLPASREFAPVARQAAGELAFRRGFGPVATDALAAAADDAFTELAHPGDRVRITFVVETAVIEVLAELVERPDHRFRRTVARG